MSVMRKVLLVSLLSLISIITTMAQQSAICGDWTGVYLSWKIVNTNGSTRHIETDYKRYIRIKLIDGNYIVRMKTRIADNSEPFNYWAECQIIEANDRMIKWKMDLGPDYDWSQDAKHKGIPIGHADYYKYCTVILSNGTLKYSEYMFTIYYDRQGREIDKEKTIEKDSQSLYKDDSDW